MRLSLSRKRNLEKMHNTAEIHRGSCFCGAVEIEVRGKPIDMGYCHCKSCRTYSGAPLVAFTIWPADKFRVVKGAELWGGFNKVGSSDRKFCMRCGGHMLLDHPHLGVVDVRATVLPTVQFVPKAHLNYGEAVMAVPDGLPKFRDMPTDIGGTGKLMWEHIVCPGPRQAANSAY